MKFSFLLIILCLFLIKKNVINSKIIFVLEHVRHGTRTPPFKEISTYTDQFGTLWEGDGELTPVGKRMHYILGINNRFKYSSLINFTRLNPKEIQIFSTNSPRTLRSLEAELHGMYLPGTGDTLSKSELPFAYPPGKEYLLDEVSEEIEFLGNSTIINGITLFPIQFYQTGKIFLNEPDNCPYMTTYRLELANRINETLTKFMKEFDGLFGDKLKEYLNRPNKDFIYTYGSLIDVTDNFICNYDNGKDLTDFIKKTGFNKTEFYEYAKKVKEFYLFHLSSDQTAGIIGATPIMTDLINYMENKINNENNITYSEPKMVIQGGHDTTLNAIEHFMNAAFEIPLEYITFGSHMYFELHKEEENNNKYIVKYYFNGRLLLEKDFNLFKEKILKTIWSEEKIHNFCFQEEENKDKDKEDNKGDNDKSNNDDKKAIITFLIITNIIFIILIGILVFLYCLNKNKNNSSDIKSNKDEKLLEDN